MDTKRIAVIPGDGVGREVTSWATAVLEAAVRSDQRLGFDFVEFPWGCDYYARTGAMMPADGLDQLARFDHIVLGAVGWPSVPDHLSLWGLLIPIRRRFQQYVNLRPARLMPGIRSPLRDSTPFDVTIIRENTEGEYSDIGGRLHVGEPNEMAVQSSVFTRVGTERIIRHAFDLAVRSKGRVVGATKSNGMKHIMPYWDEVFREVGAGYPGVETRLMHADALAARLVLSPQDFDVIVASNLLGDILSEITAAIQGSIGMAASANINPDATVPAMFEPVHGSAPDIAGRGLANPIGAMWSAKLLLDHLGHHDLGSRVLEGIEQVVRDDCVTPDLGGRATTDEVGRAIVDYVAQA